MKCPNCGFENRPEARFCKQCGDTLLEHGEPLQAPSTHEAPPPPSGTICPACGATAKPGARFCPRCGKALEAKAAPPSPPSAQPSPAAQETAPSMPAPQMYATPSSTPPPAQPSTAPPATEDRFPRWLWWVGGIAAFLCLAAVLVVVLVLKPNIFGAGEEPTATPTAAPSPTAEATATVLPPTAPPATTPPTAVPPTEPPPPEPAATTPTAEPPAIPAFGAQVSISPSVTELRVNEPLTVTVTVVNSGEVTFGNLRYQLLGEWQPYLRVTTSEVVEHESDVVPGQSDAATFVLEAMQPGTARLQANVTVKTREDPPAVKPVLSGQTVEISVIP